MPRMRRKVESRQARVVESSEYAAMLERLIIRYGERAAEDPAILAHAQHLQQALTDAINMGIHAATRQGRQPYSLAEIGRIMGIAYQSAQKRARRGEAALVQLLARRTDGAVVQLAVKRAERAAALAAAGVEDRTGSQRELEATGTTGPIATIGRALRRRSTTP